MSKRLNITLRVELISDTHVERENKQGWWGQIKITELLSWENYFYYINSQDNPILVLGSP